MLHYNMEIILSPCCQHCCHEHVHLIRCMWKNKQSDCGNPFDMLIIIHFKGLSGLEAACSFNADSNCMQSALITNDKSSNTGHTHTHTHTRSARHAHMQPEWVLTLYVLLICRFAQHVRHSTDVSSTSEFIKGRLGSASQTRRRPQNVPAEISPSWINFPMQTLNGSMQFR